MPGDDNLEVFGGHDERKAAVGGADDPVEDQPGQGVPVDVRPPHDVTHTGVGGGEQQVVRRGGEQVDRALIADTRPVEPRVEAEERRSRAGQRRLVGIGEQDVVGGVVLGEPEFAKRVLVFKDGRVRKDEPVRTRPRAKEVLRTLPTLED